MADPNDATAGHNAANRAELIRSYIDAKLDVDEQRGDLFHAIRRLFHALRRLNERMGDEREILRAANISVKACDEMARLKKMEQEARDAHLDAWREAFAAADLGYQPDMFANGGLARVIVQEAAE